MRLVRKIEQFEICRARLGKTPIVETPIFVMFTLFLIATHSETMIHLVVAV